MARATIELHDEPYWIWHNSGGNPPGAWKTLSGTTVNPPGAHSLTCLSCHDVHASDQQHLMRAKGTNGKEAVTITYTTTPKGGNCTVSCHDALGYERK